MSAYIPVELRRRVRALFANCCAYCRTSETLTVTIFEIEHIIPRSAGGGTVLDNLCLACPTCNRFKAYRQTVSDPVTQQVVPVFHPQRQKWQEHFAWSEDATEIKGLSPIGRATIAALRMNRSQLIRLPRLWVKMGEHASPRTKSWAGDGSGACEACPAGGSDSYSRPGLVAAGNPDGPCFAGP